MDVTQTLARYLVESRLDDIPREVRHEAARALLNWLGCAIGACTHETVQCALAALGAFSGPPQAQVFGRAERLDCLHAALINGISSHVLDYDDTHPHAIHPSAPVWPALLALGEWRGLGGAQLVHAFVLGVEAECRIGDAVYPAHYDAGWHATGTCGVFGAAAAAGKLLGLDSRQMAWALGIAATQSAGLREMFGSMCKSLHPGRAAQNGLAAALLASKNFTSSERGLEAPRGFAHVLASARDFSAITEGLGKSHALMQNMYKPFACGLVVQPAIDGCIQLRNEHKLAAADIARVEVRGNPLVLELTGKTTPQTGLEGKFSIYHACAVGLLFGAAGEPQFADAVVRDPQVVALRAKVSASVDRAVRKDEAYVTIGLADGRTLEKHVEHAIGTLERPMSDADLERKFRGLTTDTLAPRRIDELIALCWNIGTLADAGAIGRASAPS
ncbi:MAG TPA: MmgE/PrpD family protein [Burkholderiales bacterium]|nr:MmgE/PrpD family protein [Burkholderiales bacterium]